MKRLVAIGAHHDDIEVPCAGTFAKYAQRGYECSYVVATQSPNYNQSPAERAHGFVPDNAEVIEVRKNEARAGASLLGAAEVCFWDFKCVNWYPEGSLQRTYLDGTAYRPEAYEFLMQRVPGREFIQTAARCPASIDFVADFLRERAPEIVLTHTPCDTHPEHYATAMLVRTALVRWPDAGLRPRLFAWEQGSRMPVISYAPTHLVDISATMPLKLRAVDGFASQCVDQEPGSRRGYCEAQNHFWGELAGVPYAEAFTEYLGFYAPTESGQPQMQDFRDRYATDCPAAAGLVARTHGTELS